MSLKRNHLHIDFLVSLFNSLLVKNWQNIFDLASDPTDMARVQEPSTFLQTSPENVVVVQCMKPLWFVPGCCHFQMARACAACRKRDCVNWLCFIWMSMPSEQSTAKWIYPEHNMFTSAIHLHFIAVVPFLFITFPQPCESVMLATLCNFFSSESKLL